MGTPANVDWPGLLKWSLQYTDGTSQRPARSKEDMEFLEKAIKEALKNTPDPIKVATEALTKLGSESDAECLSALMVIEECTEHSPELARIFTKINGVKPLLESSKRNHFDSRAKALDICTSILPNNPELQAVMRKEGALNLFMNGFHDCQDPENGSGDEIIIAHASELKPSYLSCVCGLVRGEFNAQKDFLRKGGLQMLAACLVDENPRVKSKGANLLRYFVSENLIQKRQWDASHIVQSVCQALDAMEISEGAQAVEDILHLVEAIIKPYTTPEKIEAELLLRSSDAKVMKEALTKQKQLFEADAQKHNEDHDYQFGVALNLISEILKIIENDIMAKLLPGKSLATSLGRPSVSMSKSMAVNLASELADKRGSVIMSTGNELMVPDATRRPVTTQSKTAAATPAVKPQDAQPKETQVKAAGAAAAPAAPGSEKKTSEVAKEPAPVPNQATGTEATTVPAKKAAAAAEEDDEEGSEEGSEVESEQEYEESEGSEAEE